MWENNIDIHDIKEIRVKTTSYLGVGAISKFKDIARELKEKKLDKVVIVSSATAYKVTGAWDVIEPILNENKIEYVIYDKIAPNPDNICVDEAAKMALDFGAKAVIGIGGGSPLDAAKSIAILLEYPEETGYSLFEGKFIPSKAVPIIAINLTHGTGSEVNRFAVVSIPNKQHKPAIAYDCIYPLYSIDDPALMSTLSTFQTTFVSVDAVNHVFEASTSIATNPLSCLLAKETVRLVHKYLPIILKDPQNIEARYYLVYASLIAGTSFDNGLLHFTHALEHPLSAIKTDFTHGLGLALLLPAVAKQVFDAKKDTILEIMAPIFGNKKDIDANEAARLIRHWLESVGVHSTLKDEGFSENDVDKLVELTFSTPSLQGLLNCAPIKATKEVVKQIYEDSL